MSTISDFKRAALQSLGYLGSNQDMENQFWQGVPYFNASSPITVNNLFTLKSQIYTANATLTSSSPYRSIANNASGITIALPSSPTADETRVCSNVGAGSLTVTYTGRSGASTKVIAQDNAQTFAFNSTLGYWTLE